MGWLDSVKEEFNKGANPDQYKDEELIKIGEFKRTSHLTHFILSVVSAGMWIPIWILFGLLNSQHNKKIDNDMRLLQHKKMMRGN